MNKHKKFLYIGILFILLFTIFLSIKSTTKLTYLEQTFMNRAPDTYTVLQKNGDSITQDFSMPYSILHDISIQLGTFNRTNYSKYDVSIKEKDNNNLIYHDTINADFLTDNAYYTLEVPNNIKVHKDTTYQLIIKALNVSANNNIAFYHSNFKKNKSSHLFLNDQPVNGELCFWVSGGDTDYWWTFASVLIGLYLLFLLFRGHQVLSLRKNCLKDRIFISLLLLGIIMILRYSFISSPAFWDENDHIRGGMMIANGNVLYRDYITQHMPFGYYLCALFSLTGAGSIAQFRLCYYLMESMIGAFMYYRHSEKLGTKTMFVLPIAEVLLLPVLSGVQGTQIIADNIQGTFTVVLLLEFLEYHMDKTLKTDRSILISLCILSCVFSAFVSLYALMWIVIAILITEISFWKQSHFHWPSAWKRYRVLLLSFFIPIFVGLLYFAYHHTLTRAYDMSFLFNQKVYPNYWDACPDCRFTTNPLAPFILVFQNCYTVMRLRQGGILGTALLFIAVYYLVILLKKREFYISVVLLLVMIFSGCRTGFHYIPVWYIAIMTAILCISKTNFRFLKIMILVLSTYTILKYTTFAYQYFSTPQKYVLGIDSTIVEQTKENEEILIDAYTNDSIYLMYKKRYPANRLIYLLPWYIDWYEQDLVDDLLISQPNIIVYNTDTLSWGYPNGANHFNRVLKRYYHRYSDNPEDIENYSIWIKN